MRLTGALLFGCIVAGAFLLTPAEVQADQWQKSSDGYWYYWGDRDQRWYYQEGSNWYVQNANGAWVPWSGYSSYYYEPQTSYYNPDASYQSYYYPDVRYQGRYYAPDRYWGGQGYYGGGRSLYSGSWGGRGGGRGGRR